MITNKFQLQKYSSLLILLLMLEMMVNAQPTDKSKSGTLKSSGYAPVNGLKLYYEIHGNGYPLVLLHGGLGAIEMFGNILPSLTEVRQVIAVDLQGHGRTADIDRPLNIEFLADDIAALLKYLKVEKADIMGYSLGGGVALQTAIRHLEIVNKLIVVSTPFKNDAFYPEILAQQAQIGPAAAEFLKQTPMYQQYAELAPKIEDWPILITKIGEAMKISYNWSDKIKTIKAQTLIIAGDADIFPPSHAIELFNLLGGGLRDGGWDGSGLSNSRLAILPGLTHYNIFASPSLATTAIAFLDIPKSGTADQSNDSQLNKSNMIPDKSVQNIEMQNLVFTRTFNASVKEVWNAWSEPDYIMQWWGPAGFTCPLANMDFRKGGTSIVCMRAPKEFGGQDMYNTWTYEEIVPMERFVYILKFSDKNGNRIDPSNIGLPHDMPKEMRNEVAFKDLGNGITQLIITEYNWPVGQMMEMSKMGMEQCLDKMTKIFVEN